MDRQGEGRGLDGADGGAGSSARPGPQRGLRNPVIGIIGKSILDPEEAEDLYYVGRCIGRLGHVLAFIEAKGTTQKVREGVEIEGGELLPLAKDVIGHADHTLIYPDRRLLARLLSQYPSLMSMTNVLVIREDQLEEWVEACETTLEDKGIPLPE